MRAILAGGGEMAFFLARNFLSKGYEVSIINKNQKECERLSKLIKITAVIGDESDPQALKKAGAEGAQILLAATSKDYVNLACCLTAINMFKVPEVFTIVNDPDNHEIFTKLGIKQVLNKTDMIVSLLEKNVESIYVAPLISYADIIIYEVKITADMPSVGFEADKIDIPSDADIIGVIRENKLETTEKHLVIQPEDRVILLAKPEALAYSIRMLCGEVA